MRKVSLVLALAAIMAGSIAMAADWRDNKGKEASVSATATSTAESVPAINGMDAALVKGAVQAYIEKDVALKGGIFLLNDVQGKKSRVLSLKNFVLSSTPVVQAVDASVLSVDMVPVKGEKSVVSVDFQVKKGANGSLDVASIVVRKVGKKERFIYDANGQAAPVPKKAKKSRR